MIRQSEPERWFINYSGIINLALPDGALEASSPEYPDNIVIDYALAMNKHVSEGYDTPIF